MQYRVQKTRVHIYTNVSVCTDAHIIKWSPDGERYVTVITNKVDIYKLDTASITGTITTEKRISSLRFITVSTKKKGAGKLTGLKHMKLITLAFLFSHSKDSILAIAGDDEIIRFYSCDSQKCLCEFKAHENRYSIFVYYLNIYGNAEYSVKFSDL